MTSSIRPWWWSGDGSWRRERSWSTGLGRRCCGTAPRAPRQGWTVVRAELRRDAEALGAVELLL
ncbi:hypothetical protein [Actinoplanes sp. NPDC023714]|uniref:hypothetical protein n=1 Tax=Actinoplanes sp. NPDC023714 TaxID=3154322 RepID=UPI0033C27143